MFRPLAPLQGNLYIQTLSDYSSVKQRISQGELVFRYLSADYQTFK